MTKSTIIADDPLRTRLKLLLGPDLDRLEAKAAEHADDPEEGKRALRALLGEYARATNGHGDVSRVVLTPYSDIEAKRTVWAWDCRFPHGALTLMVGTEGLGKTAFGLSVAAKLTRGTLPGMFEGEPVKVAMFTPEDDASATLKKRLLAADADVSRVVDVKMKADAYDRGFSLPGDTGDIIDALAAADVRFAFIDPLASMLDPSLNSWKDTDIREAFEPFVGGLAEHGIGALGTLHTNKTNSTDPRQRGMGSAGWRQVVRAAFLVSLDPDDPEGDRGPARCIAHTKHNLGPWTRTVRFALDTAPVEVEGEPENVVKVTMGDECNVTAAQMLAAEQGHENPDSTKEGKAAVWLYSLLNDGPKAVSAIKEAADTAGYSWRTVERAKKDISAEAFQPKGVRGWSWALPADRGLMF